MTNETVTAGSGKHCFYWSPTASTAASPSQIDREAKWFTNTVSFNTTKELSS